MADAQSTGADTPFAVGIPSSVIPIADETLRNLVAPFAAMSVAQRFRGPNFFASDGTPCIVMITHDLRPLRFIRERGELGLVAWRWDNSPSMFVSFTLVSPRGFPPPYTRWMHPSDSDVVQRIRTTGRFLMTVSTANGKHSVWHEARLRSGVGDAPLAPDLTAFERLWTFPTPGLPRSSTNARYEIAGLEGREKYGPDEPQIPLWADPVADFWKTLDYEGPWAVDLERQDRARCAWGAKAWRTRHTAAGAVELFIQRRALDRDPSPFTSAGRLLTAAEHGQFNAIIDRFPVLGEWVAAIAGPSPNARHAHDCMLRILREPEATYELIRSFFQLIHDLPIDDLMMACRMSFEAALLDSSVTSEGTGHPWLRNAGLGHLKLETRPLDMGLPRDAIDAIWRGGPELIELLDGGLYLQPDDVPIPYDILCEELKSIVLESSVEQVEEQTLEFLSEALDARQWTIPWGARVELSFGPFVALRIYDLGGEFACHFLDVEDRYFPVALGLDNPPPRASTLSIVKRGNNDGDFLPNDEAEAAIKLVAAAIVRDFLVVEEREALFSARNMRKRIRGRDVRTVIYLPRVRYATPRSGSLDERAATSSSVTRTRHTVAQHLRRARKASAEQRFLAQRYGVHLPQGFTFVRAHERGVGAEALRVKVYRSRSASKMLFEELEVAPEGTRPKWFDFEKDCARLLRSRGMKVIHQAAHRDADGGVDLYAVDGDGQPWVVQCKCWAPHREVPPAVIRELSGAIALADAGASRRSRGVVITTSRFSRGAIKAAEAFSYELIDGQRLVAMVAEVSSPTAAC